MKIRVLLPALVLIAQVVDAGRFDLPKENPQISIQMPDNWQTALDGESITARPANNSKVMISVFPVSGASNLKEAFSMATKQLSATYGDVKIGEWRNENKQALPFSAARAKAKRTDSS